MPTENLKIEYARLKESQSYAKKVSEILSERYENPPVAFVHSYGCQQSAADGERIQGILCEMGYGVTKNSDEADVIFFNTCAVREHAEKRVLGNLGALKHNKARKKEMVIGISGCMTQQAHVAEKIKKSYKHVDIVLGTNSLDIIPRLVYEKLVHNNRYILEDKGEQKNSIVEGLPTLRSSKHKATVTIMQGCDNFCAYCIVPYVRGREVSRDSQSIIAEIKELVQDGCLDITLLGQNVNSYGKGLEEDVNFSQLLRRINEIEGDFRIRFMTSHPKDCTRELIDTIAECEKVSKQLHLPVQSGSNRILAEMNRKYTVEDYKELIAYAKSKIDGLVLTSDIIVGFPGETYEDFTKTLELVREIEYIQLYTFIYSKRSGTKAEKLDDPVSAEEKSRRFNELLQVQEVICARLLNEYVGKRVRVLPDALGKGGAGTLVSRNDAYTTVELLGEESLIGKFVDVEITEALKWALRGKLCT